MNFRRCALLVLAATIAGMSATLGRDYFIQAQDKFVLVADARSNLVLRVNLDGRCMVDRAYVRGRQVIAAETGAATGILVSNCWHTTRKVDHTPMVKVRGNTLRITGIHYGPADLAVDEEWQFKAGREGIDWEVSRSYGRAATIEDTLFPGWDFENMSTWKGGITGNGGVAWNRYLEGPNATYGTHASSVTFWNKAHDDALRVTAAEASGDLALRFSHQPAGPHSAVFSFATAELEPRHGLNRYHAGRQDLWRSFPVAPGRVKAWFRIEALKYSEAYDRGVLTGLDGRKVREVMNTIGRYGVIDRKLVGANGWRTGYICLHEQWFSQIGIALMDPNYLANCAASYDRERDHAILADGRVKSRWAYTAFDAMPGTYDSLGYYEAQWGYLMDSQTCYPMCVAELFDLTGDRAWLSRQKAACERVLEYLMARDSDQNGLVEMRTGSHAEQRGSDWIDIIWAAHENALVNAELFYALQLWADLERLLGNPGHEQRYRAFAARLKDSFNRPVSEGGFWDPRNQWYIYWRDKDGSVHGNNLVTPVNFAAIAYGVCDDPGRAKVVLDRMEFEMKKENLFFWPLNFFPYEREEGHAVNFPYPKYENGDIFLSWGELAVRAYCRIEPRIALKYVRNVLAKYEADGLSFQRYRRKTQAGAGEDILAGNCMAIVGLYRDIYGLQPKHNRLYIEPHLSPELDGTGLRYALRGQDFTVELACSGTRACVEDYGVASSAPFALDAHTNTLVLFRGAEAEPAMRLRRANRVPLEIALENWGTAEAARTWTETAISRSVHVAHEVCGLAPSRSYRLTSDDRKPKLLKADAKGVLRFDMRVPSGRRLRLQLAAE